MSNTQDLKLVLDKKLSIMQGDAERIAKQRAQGKLTARERVGKLLDQGSFVETDALLNKGGEYAGVVTGYGTVEDRPVYIFAQDYTVGGGAMSEMQADKILKVLSLAEKNGAPVVAMCDSAGVKLAEGAKAMNAYARVFAKMARLSGVVPMIAVVLGPCVGGAAMMTRLCDVTVMTEKNAELMVYGPLVMSAVSGKNYNDATAGGAAVLAKQGAVAVSVASEDDAIAATVQLLGLLPASNAEDAPIVDTDDMNRLLPEVNADDAASLMTAMADAGQYMELYKDYGKEIAVALARVGGRSVGLVVSNAAVNNGELTADSAAKAARFIRMCDCFNLPVVSMINSKGVAVPAVEEQGNVMNAVSQLLYAYAEATTAKVSVIVGNAIGQSYVAMASKGIADATYAWAGAVVSALTPDAAVQVLYVDELRAGKNRAELETAYAAEVAGSLAAAADGMVDDVIEPAETRKYVIAALEMLFGKRDSNPPKKHGNLPM